jgi:ubiquinone/menaquinone biosynthesis C-methylase UbiE
MGKCPSWLFCWRKFDMEKIKKTIKKYWNWRSESFLTDRTVTISKQWEIILKELVSGSPGRLALDIGTGRGHFAVYLARLGFFVTGIDLSENMISYARQNAACHNLGIDFQTGDAEELEFEDNTFDVVVSRNLLWTLPSPDKALKEWRRVLKPGGTLVMSDGFWMNYTWKSLHHLAFSLLKNKFGNGSMLSVRFYCCYAFLQKSLPFYEGICFEKASMLLQTARFKDIKSYDISCFGINPYGLKKRTKKRELSFFIVHAKV